MRLEPGTAYRDVMDNDWDVLVIGRSYAGLSAALAVGRGRRSALVVGEGGPRNAAVRHVHNLFSHDGADPAVLVRDAEQQLDRYPGIELVTGRVTALTAIDGGFRATAGGRGTTASLVVFATGINDTPPDVPGLADHWGRGVYTCPFCDGFEHADEPLAIVGDTIPPARVTMLANWSDQLTVYATDPNDALAAACAATGATLERRPVAAVRGDGERLTTVELADGTAVPTVAAFVIPTMHPNSQLAVELGCAVDDQGFLLVDEQRRTNVAGVFAAGDVTRPMLHQMSVSIADGAIAGAGAVHDLLMAA